MDWQSSRALIEALARDDVSAEERHAVERLLEQNPDARDFFRQLTAARFPTLPNYTIVAQVGKGGFGVVYKAIHHTKERSEALKVLFGKTPLLASYFENEVHLIAKLRHANIATLFDAQLATPPLFYTMEFVEGQRLNDYVKSRDVTLAQRVEVVRKVALAMDYAHRQGVVHRDIKPQNVLIDAAGEPHVVDFGIALRLGLARAAGADSPQPEGPVGTIGYIAPEQMNGQPVDARADVFALGALLFHCVTGEPAKHASEPGHVLRALRERRVTQPDDLAAVIQRCLAEEPGQRYATAAALATDLDNYLAGRDVVARGRQPLRARLRRISKLLLRRHPMAVRVAALALVAVLLTQLFTLQGARYVYGTGPAHQTMMVVYTPESAAAAAALDPDIAALDLEQRGALRVLYGKMLQKLSLTRPRVVVLDATLADCRPEFDAAFIAGANKLASQHTPVIVGAKEFDARGEPRICAQIRAAIHGCGTLMSVAPDWALWQYEVVHCVRRGHEAPFPSLSVAAYAAARFADCDPALELNADGLLLSVRYRRHNPEAEESRFEATSDELPLERVTTVGAGDLLWLLHLKPGDKVAHARITARPADYWATHTLTFHEVLVADADQIGRWFLGKVVVLGDATGRDVYRGPRGERLNGCQVHAETIDNLISMNLPIRMSLRDLAVRCCIWAAVAGLVAGMPPAGRGLTRVRAGVLMGVGALGLVIGSIGALYMTQPVALESTLAVGVLLASGSAALLARLAAHREMLLLPGAATAASDDATNMASTILAGPTPS